LRNTPKVNKNRAVNRRASQNKAPKSSLDLRPTTINWNVNAERAPSFNNTISKDNKIYTVRQTSNQGTVISSSGAVTALYARAWTSADILQFSSFASIFDQYKIEMLEIWLTPYGVGTIPGYIGGGKFVTVIDYDDANAPTSLQALQEYQNAVTTRFTDGHYIKFRPHIAEAAYGGTFTQFLNRPSDWIDCGSTAAQHYGLKLAMDVTPSTNDVRMDLSTRITVSFRNVF
jgi:hypothetical protein